MFLAGPKIKNLHASLHQISNLLTLVSCDYSITFLMVRKYPADKSFIPGRPHVTVHTPPKSGAP